MIEKNCGNCKRFPCVENDALLPTDKCVCCSGLEFEPKNTIRYELLVERDNDEPNGDADKYLLFVYEPRNDREKPYWWLEDSKREIVVSETETSPGFWKSDRKLNPIIKKISKCLDVDSAVIEPQIFELCKKLSVEAQPSQEASADNLRKVYVTSGELPDGRIFDEIFDRSNMKASFAIWDGLQVNYEDSIIDGTTKYLPSTGNDLRKGAIILPIVAIDYESDDKLNEEVRRYIHTYIGLPPFFENLCVWYVKLTYMSEKLTVIPYLRFLGDTGTGKSRALEVIGCICYRPISIAGSVGAAPIFRLIERWHNPTLIIDEADFGDSSLKSDLVKILNCGYSRHTKVFRCGTDKRNEIIVEVYDAFGPKLMASRKTFDDIALESRCLTCIMMQSDRTNIPDTLSPSFYIWAENLRCKLLMWKFKNYKQFSVDYDKSLSISDKRLQQLIRPLIGIIKNPQDIEQFLGFATKYIGEIYEKRLETNEGEVAIELIYCYNRKCGNWEHCKQTVGNLADCLNSRLGIRKDDKVYFTARRVGQCLETLGLKRKHTADGRKIIFDKTVVHKIGMRYNLNVDERHDDGRSPPPGDERMNVMKEIEEYVKDNNIDKEKEECIINNGDEGRSQRSLVHSGDGEHKEGEVQPCSQEERINLFMNTLKSAEKVYEDSCVPLNTLKTLLIGKEYEISHFDTDLRHLRENGLVYEAKGGKYRCT